jgi:hypothetical protein
MLRAAMKNIDEVLRKKEFDLEYLQREVEVLQIAARLLAEDGDADASNGPSSITARRAAETGSGTERLNIKQFP